MYKVASDKRQSALHRGRLGDWAHGQEHQSKDDQIANLKKAIAAIERQLGNLLLLPDTRRQLGRQKAALAKQISELKGPRLRIRGLGDWFIDVAKEQLPLGQFKAMMAAAKRLHLQNEEKNAERRTCAASGSNGSSIITQSQNGQPSGSAEWK
jgi:hypothetical protein